MELCFNETELGIFRMDKVLLKLFDTVFYITLENYRGERQHHSRESIMYFEMEKFLVFDRILELL